VDLGEGPGWGKGVGDSGGVRDGHQAIKEAADEDEEVLWLGFGFMGGVLECIEAWSLRCVKLNFSSK